MNTAHYKDLLLKEQERLIEAMQTIGQLSEVVPGDWETHADPNDNKETEPDALADKFEEETTNEGVLDTLEERLKEVNDALVRIDQGTYGKCASCGNQIEKERLEANPAATTCANCKI
jgi:RNA polymerase-binding transcription factor DksA